MKVLSAQTFIKVLISTIAAEHEVDARLLSRVRNSHVRLGTIVLHSSVTPWDVITFKLQKFHLRSQGNDDYPNYYSRWESSGINLQHVLRFVNDSYSGVYEEIDGEYSRSFGAFPEFVVNTKEFGPELWASTSVNMRRTRGSIGERLLALYQPFFYKALGELRQPYSVSTADKYPAFMRVLQTTGIPPLAFQLDDYTGCAKYNYRIDNNTFITVPVFTLCADRACPNALAVPTYKMWNYSRQSRDEWQVQFEIWEREYPWDKKISKVY